MIYAKRPTLSLCMIVKNEQKLLRRCLNRLRGISDEIIIIDTGSQDNTIKIAESFGAKVSYLRMGDDFLKARNEYLKKTSCDWILTLDADELISRRDLGKLKKLLLDKSVSGYIMPIRNYINNSNVLRQWHPSKGEYPEEEICSGWFLSESIRLFRGDKKFAYEGCLLQPDVKSSIIESGGKIKECLVPIHHHSYLKYRDPAKIEKKQSRYLKISLKSLKAYPKNPCMYFNAGNILFLYKKDYNKAVYYLKKAVELSPSYVRGYWLLALAYQKLKMYNEAENVLKMATKAGIKDNSLTYFFLGELFLRRLDFDRAFKYLKKAIKLNSENPGFHNALGTVYELQGKTKLAENEYKRAFKLNKKDSQAYYNLKRVKRIFNKP